MEVKERVRQARMAAPWVAQDVRDGRRKELASAEGSDADRVDGLSTIGAEKKERCEKKMLVNCVVCVVIIDDASH